MAKGKIDSPLSQSVGADPKAAPDKWETQGHLDTLIKAHEIMNNPVHLKAVHKLAGRHHKAISGIKSLGDLKELSNQKHLAKGQGLKQLAAGGEPDDDSE